MEDRRRLIEEHAGRPVVSLRALTHEEGIALLSKLGESAPPRAEGLASDERDEETWIARL